MKKIIFIAALSVCFSVAAETLSEPVVYPTTQSTKEPVADDPIQPSSSEVLAPNEAKTSSTSSSVQDRPSAQDSSPIQLDAYQKNTYRGFEVYLLSDIKDKKDALIGTILISDGNTIEKQSTSPAYSMKMNIVNSENDDAFVYLNFSQKGIKKVGSESFDTNLFMRDIIKINLTKLNRFNVGGSVIIFSPI